MPIIDKSDFPPLSAEFFVAEFFPDRLQDPKLGAELLAERLKGADPRIVAAVLRNRAVSVAPSAERRERRTELPGDEAREKP